jgi:apolipoprotein N-acyltransferase
VAKTVGTYGLSGLVIVVAGALWHPRRLYAFPLALAGVMLAGWLSTLAAGDPGRSDMLVRVVQPNISQQTKHDESFDEVNWAKLAALTGEPGPQPRLILWSEAAVPYFLEEESWARYRIAGLIGPKDIILTGGDSFVWDKAGKNIVAARNALFAVAPDSTLIARYDKAHLVPYGEYLPMRPRLSAVGLSRLVPGDLDFWPGPGPRSITLPGFGKTGVQICYEIIFSGDVIEAKNRPDFLFNPSNDSWFGSWGAPQFLAQARLRAIEEGMPTVRSTPTGISAVIDSNGAVLVALPIGKAGVIQTTLPKVAAPTLFARLGNIAPFGFVLTLIGFAVALRRRHR